MTRHWVEESEMHIADRIRDVTWDAAAAVNRRNPYDGRSTEGRAWKRSAWEVASEALAIILESLDSPAAAPAGSQPQGTAGDPIDWKQVAVKLGQMASDWRLLSTPEAEALRGLVDQVWDRQQDARELRRDRARDEMGGGDAA